MHGPRNALRSAAARRVDIRGSCRFGGRCSLILSIPLFPAASAISEYIRLPLTHTRSQCAAEEQVLLDIHLRQGMKTVAARPPALLQCALPCKVRPFCSSRLQVQCSAVKGGKDGAVDSISASRRELILRALVIALGKRQSYSDQQPNSASVGMTVLPIRFLDQ